MTLRSSRRGPGLFLLGVALTAVLLLGAWLTQAAAGTMPPRPEPTATPRPGPGPAVTGDAVRPGALIWLKLSGVGGRTLPPRVWPGLWTVVQWQDAGGGWHDVTGWEGQPDEPAQKVWWVDPKDYNTGPFRWAVWDSARQALMATSAPFRLPSADNQITEVPVGVDVSRP